MGPLEFPLKLESVLRKPSAGGTHLKRLGAAPRLHPRDGVRGESVLPAYARSTASNGHPTARGAHRNRKGRTSPQRKNNGITSLITRRTFSLTSAVPKSRLKKPRPRSKPYRAALHTDRAPGLPYTKITVPFPAFCPGSL